MYSVPVASVVNNREKIGNPSRQNSGEPQPLRSVSIQSPNLSSLHIGILIRFIALFSYANMVVCPL